MENGLEEYIVYRDFVTFFLLCRVFLCVFGVCSWTTVCNRNDFQLSLSIDIRILSRGHANPRRRFITLFFIFSLVFGPWISAEELSHQKWQRHTRKWRGEREREENIQFFHGKNAFFFMWGFREYSLSLKTVWKSNFFPGIFFFCCYHVIVLICCWSVLSTKSKFIP